MTEAMISQGQGHRPHSFTARDVVAIGFRHQKLLVLCFVGVVLGVGLSALVLPTKYRAETKLLLMRERVDPVVSADQSAPMTFHDTVAEEEINSEVELLESQDVLQKVVATCGLDKKKFLSSLLHPGQTPENRMDKAVLDLRADLQVEVLKKTNVIFIAYEQHDPKLAQKVLATLDQAYLEKHLAVHHPTGQFEFFEQQADKYKTDMLAAEGQLKGFSGEQSGVAPNTMRDMTLQKLADFTGSLQTTRASIAETQKRISDLQAQIGSTPTRQTTQMKAGDNPQVMQTLKSTLITLENKRTELLTKYQPTYPLVVEADKEIADTKAALAKEESSPLKDETTDVNPTYAWVSSELAHAKADLAGFQAREISLVSIVDQYQTQARQLDQQGILQGDLVRKEKEDEANYSLYTKKKEEARIEDALDRTRLLNVSVAQAPLLPSLPTRSPWIFALVACLLAAVVSVGVVFAIDYADQSFRTPSEVMAELRIPVLAAVPMHRTITLDQKGSLGSGSGDDHGTGNSDLTFEPTGTGSSVMPERG